MGKESRNSLDVCVNDILSIIESDDEVKYLILLPDIRKLIISSYRMLFQYRRNERKYKVIAFLWQDEFRSLLITTNLNILKIEITAFTYLIRRLYLLNSFKNKEFIKSYINMYKYLMYADFTRVEYVELNSNEERTEFSNNKLAEIQKYFDLANIELKTLIEYEEGIEKVRK